MVTGGHVKIKGLKLFPYMFMHTMLCNELDCVKTPSTFHRGGIQLPNLVKGGV